MQTNMADDQSGLLAEAGNHSLNSDTVVVTTTSITGGESEVVNEDLLEQAFVSTEDFDQEGESYTVEADSDDHVSLAQSVAQQIDNAVVSDSGLESETRIVATENFETRTYRVVNTLPDGTISLPDDLIAQADVTEQIAESEAEEVTLIDTDGQQVLQDQPVLLAVGDGEQVLQDNDQSIDQSIQDEGDQTQPLQEQQTLRFTLVENGNQSGAPLGSSQNPIRIIQQGNSYTSVQQLTNEQLQHIMQVVQQQQVARNTQESGGSVLFNPNTNTRIVYRVIYPSELHKGQQTVLHVTPKGTTTTTTTAIPIQEGAQMLKRQYRKRGKDEEEDKVDGPSMSKEEKEERKKHRPRTRSGRVSKPPKHMVKDYKHIHVLDWDEDYDDSDGGYSDYKGSDEDGHRSKEAHMDSMPDPGLSMNSSRPRNYKCQTCEKSYIGQAGLGRHYRLNPSHGALREEVGEIAVKPEDEKEPYERTPTPVLNNGSTITVSMPGGLATVGSVGSVVSSTGNMSEDSNTQDSIPSSNGAGSPVSTRIPRRGRGGFRGRGRWSFHHHTAPARRKQKLRELIKMIEDDDLMEVVLPRLVKFITLWEFMLMKLETCNASHPRVDGIYREYIALHKHVKQVCHEGLVLRQDSSCKNGFGEEESIEGSPDILKLEDEAIANALGLSSGSYDVKDLPINEYSAFRYKYLTSDPNGPAGVSAEKRTIQVVTPDELVSQSPAKRSKTTSLLHTSSSVSSTPSAVTLAPSAAAASSLLTSIVTNSGLKGTVTNRAAAQNLFHTVAIQQPQSNVLQTVTVQQPQSSSLLQQGVPVQRSTTTLLPQQQPATVLRTVSLASQDHSPTVLRTVSVPSQGQPAQTSLLRSVQQPMVISTGKQRPGIVGVSLLNSGGVIAGQKQPSVALLKTVPGQSHQRVVVAASSSMSPSEAVVVASGNNSEIPQQQQSQPASFVSVLPPSIAPTSLSFIQHTPGSTASEIGAMAPDDFLDTSGDSLVSSVSGLSSANSSGLVASANTSLPGGDMGPELGFGGVVRVNGVNGVSASNPSKLDNCVSIHKEQSVLSNNMLVTSATTAQGGSEQFSAAHSAMQSTPSTTTTTSLIIRQENGEFCAVTTSGEVFQQASASTGSILSTGVTVVNAAVPSINGQLNGVQKGEMEEEEVVSVKEGEEEEPTMLLAEEAQVSAEAMGQDELLTDATSSVEMEESGEGQGFTLHQNATLFQTEDGTVILQNPDGTTFQLQGVGDQGLTLESVQELLGQVVSVGEQVQTEML